MTREDFINEVKQIMNDADLYNQNDVEFIGADTMQVDYHIGKVYTDAWRYCFNKIDEAGNYMIPREYFKIKDFSTSNLVQNIALGIGYIILPEDYYALYSYRMKGWSVPVKGAITQDDDLYYLQSNEFTRGSYIRPIAVDTIKPFKKRVNGEVIIDTKRVLEYYSLPKGRKQEVSEALYIPCVKELSDTIDENKKLIRPLAYICASMIYSIQEKVEFANILEVNAFNTIE